MRRLLPLLLAMILLLSGCGRRAETPPEPVEPPPETEEPGESRAVSPENPLLLDSLRIEVSRSGLDSGRLMEAARRLPELLRSALADCHIQVDMVQVTIGSSPAATVQALNEGSVDLAVLPAEGFAGQETEAEVLLASGPGGEDLPLWTDCAVGFQTAIWAASTDYGLKLAGRAGKEGGLPAWEELDHARWGLLGPDSLPGRRAVDLYLADNYEGNATADLSHVAVYEDFDRLFQAAADGEIDVFLADGGIVEFGEGDHGEASSGSFFRLGETERFYEMVLAVSPAREDLSAPELNLRDPLMHTLTQLCWYDGSQTLPDGTPAFSGNGYDAETLALCRDVFGSCRYAWAENEDLLPTRRLLALEGRAAE